MSGENVTRLINVTRAEPEFSLFQPPPGYTIIEETGDSVTIKYGTQR